jgi:hypothetical protein
VVVVELVVVERVVVLVVVSRGTDVVDPCSHAGQAKVATDPTAARSATSESDAVVPPDPSTSQMQASQVCNPIATFKMINPSVADKPFASGSPQVAPGDCAHAGTEGNIRKVT